jgi:XTP/dITP diphosphohydrolase
MNKIVLASGNKGKLREFAQLFAPLDIEIVPQSDFDVPEAEETGLTFVENAIIKARNACQHTGLPAIADDSGIEVDYLLGAPGIYSSRFAGDNANDEDNLNALLTALTGVPDRERNARYQCLLVLMRHSKDPTPLICQADWQGRILHAPMGDRGFGYDPIFWVPELQCSAAELSSEQKHVISHRGKAIQKFTRKFARTLQANMG